MDDYDKIEVPVQHVTQGPGGEPRKYTGMVGVRRWRFYPAWLPLGKRYVVVDLGTVTWGEAQSWATERQEEGHDPVQLHWGEPSD